MRLMPKDKERPPQNVIAGNYLAIPYALCESDAYRTASLREKAVLAAIQRKFNGWNNGRIGVSMDEIAHFIGSANHAANKVAIGGLIERGLLAIEKIHPKGSRKSTEYRLTYASTGDHKGKVPATQEYLHWKPDAASTGQKRPQPRKSSSKSTATEGASRVAAVATGTKLSVVATATHLPERSLSRVANSATLIEYHRGTTSRSLCQRKQESGGPSLAEPRRPQSMTEDAWILAGRRASANPAAPDPGELRSSVLAHIERYGLGAQGRLATAAGILAGTMSKFISGDVNLTNRHRVALACAIPKVAAAEEKHKPRDAMNGRQR